MSDNDAHISNQHPPLRRGAFRFLPFLIILAIIVIDQVIKIHVKTTMAIGDQIHITDWFYICFIENNGMAWGMTFINKLFLSLLRIVAVFVISWYIWLVVKQGGRIRYIVFLSMIVAGAAGNIIDSMFYGLCFSPSTTWHVSELVPFGQGYAGFLMGKVVDMFYFPIIHTTWPDWMPLVGGDSFTFFSPVFNFADASITTGVLCLLVFCSRDLSGIGDTVKAALGRDKKAEVKDGEGKEAESKEEAKK